MSTRPEGGRSPKASTGIRTEIVVDRPDCPIARASNKTGGISEVNRSATSSEDGEVVEEFEVEKPVPSDLDTGTDTEEVFEFENHAVHRISRDAGRGCVCEVIEGFGCVASDVSAQDGRLRVSFYAPDAEKIKRITDALDAEFGNASLRELVDSCDASGEDLVLVDGNRMTERQKEAVRTAYEMGYFENPKRANASQVADEMGVAPSTFSEHLSSAESKILEGFFER